MGTKGPLPPKPRVGEKTSVSKIAVELWLVGLASSDQFQYLTEAVRQLDEFWVIARIVGGMRKGTRWTRD